MRSDYMFLQPMINRSTMSSSCSPSSQPPQFGRSVSPVNDGDRSVPEVHSLPSMSANVLEYARNIANDDDYPEGDAEGVACRPTNVTNLADRLSVDSARRCRQEGDDPDVNQEYQCERNSIVTSRRQRKGRHAARARSNGETSSDDDGDDEEVQDDDVEVGEKDDTDTYLPDSSSTDRMQQLATMTQSIEPVERRNLRERKRVGKINGIFSELFDRLPGYLWHQPAPGRYVTAAAVGRTASSRSGDEERRCRRSRGGESQRGRKRPSKVDTLRATIEYIKYLQQLLTDNNDDGGDLVEMECPSNHANNSECSDGFSTFSSTSSEVVDESLSTSLSPTDRRHDFSSRDHWFPSSTNFPVSCSSLLHEHSQDRQSEVVARADVGQPIMTSVNRRASLNIPTHFGTVGSSCTHASTNFFNRSSTSLADGEVSPETVGFSSAYGSSVATVEEFKNLIEWLMYDSGDKSVS